LELPESTATWPPLALLNADQLDPREREAMSRELAIGLAFEGRALREPTIRARLAQTAAGLLDKSLAQRPDDLVALRVKALALGTSGRAGEGIRVYEGLLKQAPDYERALDDRVSLAIQTGDRQGALTPAMHAVAINPWSADFHERLAHLEVANDHWSSALKEADAALRLNPFLVFAREFRIQCYLHQKDPQLAEEELKTLIGLYPGDRASLKLWFAQERKKFEN